MKTRKKIQMTVRGSKCFPNQPPTIQRTSPSQNVQPHRQPDYPPGSKTRFCPDFVSITFGCQERLYLANVCLVVPMFLSSLVNRKLQGISCEGKLIPRALLVETEPACSVDLRISTGERHDLGDASPFSTRISFLHGRAGGSTFMPKLVEVFGVRLEPFVQYSYLQASLVLPLRRPPCARES